MNKFKFASILTFLSGCLIAGIGALGYTIAHYNERYNKLLDDTIDDMQDEYSFIDDEEEV